MTAKAGQSDEQLFQNPATESLTKLMSLLATQVPAKGWTGYTGGLTERNIYYSSWRGFEIVFHVAVKEKKKKRKNLFLRKKCFQADLTKEEQRQFLGNDKVILILADYGVSVAPQFRGNVNSAAIVLQHLDAGQCEHYDRAHLQQYCCPAELFGSVSAEQPTGYRVAVFYRRRIANFSPIVTTSIIRNESLLTDLIMANCINATSATMRSPPYSSMIDASMTEETEKLVERFLVPDLSSSGRSKKQ